MKNIRPNRNWIITILFLAITGSGVKSQSLATLIEANQFYNDQDWSNALGRYNDIVKENPFNGDYWFKLGEIEYNLKNYDESIDAYKRAIECGHRLAVSYYNVACNYALLNNIEKSCEYLKTAIASGLNNRQEYLSNDSDLMNIRNSKEFKQLNTPMVDGNISRVDGWTRDIEFLKQQFELTHYRLYDKYPEIEWNQDFDQLVSRVDQLENHEIVVELMKIAHNTGAGHTYIVPPFNGINHFHQIPVELFEFSDGIFIRKTLPKYKELLGKEIVAINDVPIEELLSEISHISNPENRITNRFIGLFYATIPEVLTSFNIGNDLANTTILYKETDGIETSIIIENQLLSLDLLSKKETPEGWISSDVNAAKPLYLSNLDKTFWFEYLNDSKIVYCQLNAIRNDENRTLKEFGEDLVKFIDGNEVNSLVLDLRLNNGGNGQLNRDFLVSLIQCKKINQPGKFFTIIGSKTFSAAILLATQLDQFTETLFIGEPSGGRPSHVGDDNQIVLSYSGLIASSAKTFWQSPVSYDDRNWIAPEIYIKPSSTDFKEGNDPCIQFLLSL